MGRAEEAEDPKRPPGRPRSESCRAAILEATADLLEEQPYAKVTIESIAERAGVSKQTIYKWWTGRGQIALHAYSARQGTRIPVKDTGSVRGDLLYVLRLTCKLLRNGRYSETVAGLIAEAQSNPALAVEFRETFIAARRARITEILEQGMARGEVRANIDVPLVIDLMYGPLWYRLLLRNAPLDDAFAVAVVDHVLAAIVAPAAR
jgi:AcrR family transcriptional regulator